MIGVKMFLTFLITEYAINVSILECFETDTHPQEINCAKMLRQSWHDRYSMIHASEGNIKGEFDGEMCLKQTLLSFSSSRVSRRQYLAEEN